MVNRQHQFGKHSLNLELVGKNHNKIQMALARNEHLVLSIQTDEKASYGSVVELLAMAKEAGATRITVNDPNL